ncbi:N-acetylglucosamine 6-phosphate deacetylase [Pelagirhabdus alkalitolerans]|uniref:N-acetylglucosamine-6-phosphate deacetylase n=1 Tax=Pelagirhabdus alkalitolerans TaxID=1612202 RepID=A0A1G6GK52_9BACI|nr:N-acetylglucosamine-6-phosphate deacetylase [Pelagirhabdus alkalitolerans]SDB82223.1 N-acetylglucosamine 6-phosphate deacetylase [Pelagirhabdus alkalitolerans]
MLIYNATIHQNNETFTGSVLIENGTITQINKNIERPNDERAIDANGLHLIPGFIDTHIHGANGQDVMDASEEALDKMASYLVKEGTTSFLATTITQSNEQIENALKNTANYRSKPKSSELLGVHLEGPFVEQSKAGAQPAQFIKKPDLSLFNTWQQMAGGLIKTITMAPEHDQDQFIEKLRHDGVNVSAGHTDVNFKELKSAEEKGLNQLTHLCNAMNGIHHRDIGAVGGAFMLDSLKAEIIADGIHVSPEMLELIVQNIGSDRLLLITDAMRAKGLPAGDYELGNQPVTVTKDRATLKDGTLAGSILNMIDGVKMLYQLPNVDMGDVIKMASSNPAKQLNIDHQKGSIDIGKDADLLLVDDEFNLKLTMTKGEIAHQEGL